MYDIIIVGAGPSGLTAAIYASRAAKKVLVLEEKNYGGQIINTLNIENYPALSHISGFDYANQIYEQAKELGAEIKVEKVINIKNDKEIKKVFTEKQVYETRTIILATGTSNRTLGLTNEKALTGHGISYCATCDGAFYKQKVVAVVGGGNTALEDALYLSDIAKKVYLIHRRDAFRGDAKSVGLLKEKSNVEFVLNSVVTKVKGVSQLEEIEIISNKQKRSIKVDGLFVAIGKIPQTECFRKLINLDDDGYICSNENCHTNKRGIFVAGDVRRKKVRQLVTATSDGAVAAIEAINYLNNEKR